MRNNPLPLANWWAVPVLAASPVISYLAKYDYPAFTSESIGLLLVVTMACAVIGAVVDRAERVLPSALLVGFSCAFALSLIIDVPIWIAVIAPVVIGAVIYFARQIQVVAVFMAAVFSLSCIVFPIKLNLPNFDRYPSDIAPELRDKSVIHIVLDAHSGIEGIPQGGEGGEFRRRLVDRYLARGFAVYGGAYAHYRGTTESLSSLVNYQVGARTESLVDGTKKPTQLAHNAYFEQLSRKGFQIRVYQTGHLDFCLPTLRIESCYSYSNTLTALAAMKLPAWDKFLFLSNNWMRQSTYYAILTRVLRKVERRFAIPMALPRFVSHLQPYEALLALRRLISDVELMAPGRVFFAHLILPHHPYLLAENCEVKPAAQWADNPDVSKASISDDEFERTYRRYFEQANCVHQTLEGLFDRLHAAGRLENAIVVIHGDHGSRIHYQYPTAGRKEVLRRADYLAAYSTFFGVRAPTVSADYFPQSTPISQLFHMVSTEALKLPVATTVSDKVFLPEGVNGDVVAVDYPSKP